MSYCETSVTRFRILAGKDVLGNILQYWSLGWPTCSMSPVAEGSVQRRADWGSILISCVKMGMFQCQLELWSLSVKYRCKTWFTVTVSLLQYILGNRYTYIRIEANGLIVGRKLLGTSNQSNSPQYGSEMLNALKLGKMISRFLWT